MSMPQVYLIIFNIWIVGGLASKNETMVLLSLIWAILSFASVIAEKRGGFTRTEK